MMSCRSRLFALWCGPGSTTLKSNLASSWRQLASEECTASSVCLTSSTRRLDQLVRNQSTFKARTRAFEIRPRGNSSKLTIAASKPRNRWRNAAFFGELAGSAIVFIHAGELSFVPRRSVSFPRSHRAFGRRASICISLATSGVPELNQHATGRCIYSAPPLYKTRRCFFMLARGPPDQHEPLQLRTVIRYRRCEARRARYIALVRRGCSLALSGFMWPDGPATKAK